MTTTMTPPTDGEPEMNDEKKPSLQIEMKLPDGSSVSQAMAVLQIEPNMRNAHLTSLAASGVLSASSDRADFGDTFAKLNATVDAAKGGDIEHVSAALAAQVISLDAIYTDLAQRAVVNIGPHFDASMKLMGMALKAQSNARATAEALARIHQPREQTVHHRHYHIGPDGKAVFVENMNGGLGNAGIAYQAYTQGAPVAPLPGANQIGEPVPSAGCQGQEAMPNARRSKGKRRAQGQSECAETWGAKP
ncbi:hypothetical protein NED98_13100 [Sphingomonas sp. MMSM20]|nr:hypothetical protein [Sphingomonas lycopersici]MCW6531183.1 hypothetical protein [Sphingomonas lycopersici]